MRFWANKKVPKWSEHCMGEVYPGYRWKISQCPYWDSFESKKFSPSNRKSVKYIWILSEMDDSASLSYYLHIEQHGYCHPDDTASPISCIWFCYRKRAKYSPTSSPQSFFDMISCTIWGTRLPQRPIDSFSSYACYNSSLRSWTTITILRIWLIQILFLFQIKYLHVQRIYDSLLIGYFLFIPICIHLEVIIYLESEHSFSNETQDEWLISSQQNLILKNSKMHVLKKYLLVYKEQMMFQY